jgi:hypothetical protein
MITCKHHDKFLDDYLAGRLGKFKTFAFHAHMVLCPPCKVYLEEYRRAVEAARTQGTYTPPPQPIPKELAEAIVKVMAESDPHQADRSNPGS